MIYFRFHHFFVFFMVFCFCKTQSKAENPQIEWLNSKREVLYKKDSRSETLTFEFINNSNVDFQITKVITCCGCLVTNYDKSFISPGMVGEISMFVKFGSKFDGNSTRFIFVETLGERQEKALIVKIHEQINIPIAERTLVWENDDAKTKKISLPKHYFYGEKIKSVFSKNKLFEVSEFSDEEKSVTVRLTSSVQRQFGIAQINFTDSNIDPVLLYLRKN